MSFYRIPAVIRHSDKRDLELSKKRREGFSAAISRADIDFNVQHYRIFQDTSSIQANPQRIFTIVLIQTGYPH